MEECVKCNLCDKSCSINEAVEIRKVPCHVRCFSNESFTVWRCPHCESLHSKEPVDLIRFYNSYPFKNHKLDYHTNIAYGNRLTRLIKLGIKKSSSILDYGCGNGLFVNYLKAHGYQSAHGYDSFIPQYSSQSILDSKYDFVISHDVIEHVEEPRAFFQTLVSLIKPGGVLVLGTPNASGIELTEKAALAVELSQPYHRHILSEKVIRKLASDYQLEVRSVSHRFYFDSLRPFVNTRFMWEYIGTLGGMIDAAVEPINFRAILTSPKLLFYGFMGYFFPPKGNILFAFQLPLSGQQTSRKTANN